MYLFNLVNDKEHVAQQLAWCWCGINLALAFISVFVNLLWRFLLLGFALLQQTWCRAVSCVPGSAVIIIVIYVCVVTIDRSFTVLSGWGILISFWRVLVFSPTLLSLLLLLPFIVIIVIITGYYCYYYFHSSSSWLCVMGAWAGAGYGGRGSRLGCGQGRLLGCSCYLGLGSAAPAPRFLGTQPPSATQALPVVHVTITLTRNKDERNIPDTNSFSQ